MTALHRPIRSVRIRDTKVSLRTKFSICWRKTPCLAMSAVSSLFRTTSCDIPRDGDFPTLVLTLAHLSAELFVVPIMISVELAPFIVEKSALVLKSLGASAVTRTLAHSY